MSMSPNVNVSSSNPGGRSYHYITIKSLINYPKSVVYDLEGDDFMNVTHTFEMRGSEYRPFSGISRNHKCYEVGGQEIVNVLTTLGYRVFHVSITDNNMIWVLEKEIKNFL